MRKDEKWIVDLPTKLENLSIMAGVGNCASLFINMDGIKQTSLNFRDHPRRCHFDDPDTTSWVHGSHYNNPALW